MNIIEDVRVSHQSLSRALGAVIIGVATVSITVASPYTETYEVAPAGGFAALLSSPYGVHYDFYAGRAVTRMAGLPITVIGSGDEGFYFGSNSFLGHYADDNSTSYLLNGYGTGETSYGSDPHSVLGIDFTNGPTHVYSADFSCALGSNAPTEGVSIVGLLGGVVQWTQSSGVTYGTTATVSGGAGLVDRIEIIRDQNTTALFHQFPLAWYVMDNLSFDASGSNDGYTWHPESSYTYRGQNSTPEPSGWVAMGCGLLSLGLLRRRRRS